MATQEQSPCLEQVLLSCKYAAKTSLNGPGRNCYLNDTGVGKKVGNCDEDPPSLRQLDNKHEQYTKASFKKKWLLLEDSRKNKLEDTSYNNLAGPDSKRQPASLTPADRQLSPSKGKDVSTSTNPGGVPEDSWVEPTVFLAPPPFPPLPVPILAAADKGSPGAGREDTLLDGEPIACFSVGGEKRLCLPQILNSVLRDFSLGQINAVCDDLRIYCSRCTPAQLEALRVAGVLPSTATSCGLITNSDAQRLTQALLSNHPARAPLPPPAQRPEHPQLRVYHTCFGKCKGLVWDDLFTGPDAACIECEECHGLLPPARFVCHAHRNLENQTIHWGFDAEQWRTYLLLAKDQQLPIEKAEAQLKSFKNKFGPAGSKRKQDGVEVKEELPKKVRGEEVPPPPPPPTTVPGHHYPPPYSPYDPLLLPYMMRCPTLPPQPPSWTATPLLTRDGKALPPPPLGFVRDSTPMTVPPYLSQGPPVLADPGRVVPMSDSQKFERHYQPNVALAPPKMGRALDCIKRENSPLSCVSIQKVPQTHQQQHHTPTQNNTSSPCQQHSNSSRQHPSSPRQHPSSPRQHPSSPSRPPPSPHVRKVMSPDTSTRHPELELSTTDSDTDSVNSLGNHSEIVEEAEGLLRGWSDRLAAEKVAQLVADLTCKLAAADRDNAILRRRLQLQNRDRSASRLHTQTKSERVVVDKCSVMEGDMGGLPPSVITPTSPIKTEPSDIADSC